MPSPGVAVPEGEIRGEEVPGGETSVGGVPAGAIQWDNLETLDQYVQVLVLLSRDCNFRAVSAEEHRDGAVREAFIQGIRSAPIRQRLLETTQTGHEALVCFMSSIE